MSNLVVIAGKARAGKDSIANVLIKEHGFKRVALADPLKIKCAIAFNLAEDYFHLDHLKDKDFDQPLTPGMNEAYALAGLVLQGTSLTHSECYTFIMNKFQAKGFFKSPRDLLQYVGTEIGRALCETIWIDFAISNIKEELNKGNKVVVPDGRFADERETLRNKLGATLVLVERPDFETSIPKHSSESDFGDPKDYDKHFLNNSSLDYLNKNVLEWSNSL